MSRNFDHALAGLRHTYPSPDPARRDEFLRSLPQNEEKKDHAALPFLHIGGKPVWFAFPAVAAAAVMLTVGIQVYRQNPPHQIPSIPVETTTTTTEEMTEETFAPTETETLSPTAPSSETVPSLFPTESQTETIATLPASGAGQIPKAETSVTVPAVTPVFPGVQTVIPQESGTLPPSLTLISVQTTTTSRTAVMTDPTEDAIATIPTDESANEPSLDPVEPISPTTVAYETTTPATESTAQSTHTTTVRTTHGVTTTTTTTTTVQYTHTAVQTTNTGAIVATTTAATYTGIATTGVAETDSPIPIETAETIQMDPSEIATEETENPTTNQETGYPPYTPVTPLHDYSVSGYIQTWKDLWFDTAPTSESDLLTQMVNAADEIILGRVTGITYTSCRMVPYTQIDVAVQTDYKGQHYGGTLSYYEPGGYVPLDTLMLYSWAQEKCRDLSAERITQTTIHMESTALSSPQIGGTYLFFLHHGTSDMPQGAYTYVISPDLSRIDGGGTVYSSVSGDLTFTEAQLQNAVH